jgi:hypothetical protein
MSSGSVVGGRSRVGAFALIAFAVLGLAWFALELAPPNMGFEDTDSPAVSLRFLHDHGHLYAQGGVALLLMAVSLVVATLAVWDALAARADGLALRTTTALGLFAAAFFLMHGVLRLGVGPLLYIDGLDRDWGEAAYLAIQMIGLHGFAQAAITAACLWAVGVSVIGLRTRALPVALCVLALIPAFRLVGVLGPLGILDALPGETWFLFMASIPGLLIWCLLFGLVSLRRALSPATTDHVTAAATA